MERPIPDTFDKITDLQNIKGAYFDIVLKFDTASQSGRYRGVDGVRMSELDFASLETIRAIREEMLGFAPISPAYEGSIPKKNGSKRAIHVYAVRERIKAEAIYRVLMPLFDAHFSPYLFSYRSSHPSHYAARSAVRRYKRHYGEDLVLVTDISSYADTIDHDILTAKLVDLGLDAGTRRLLGLFIKTDVMSGGKLMRRQRGVLTGTPLYALLSNLYMDDFDKWAGKQVALYRRVGDDMIAMDKDPGRVKRVSERLSETVSALKIRLNADKAMLIPNTQEFKFLGYSFRDGKIGLDASSRRKALASWDKSVRSSRARTEGAKVRHLKSILRGTPGNIGDQMAQIFRTKSLVDDTDQVKAFSESVFRMLTSFFMGSYSAKNRRLAEGLMRRSGVSSLFSYYQNARATHRYE
jgi:retron-type reverse transcriptase